MKDFSSKNRAEIISNLSNGFYDVLVIGGGITGAGIALDASTRGLKVALVDMQDFAGGTSSKSTKLIHGGLRYLKQLEFKLVAEVGKEREIVHRNAPHLTKPEPMLLPIVKNGSLGKFSARIGMWVYEWLAGVKKEEWHKVLTKEQTLRLESSLNASNLLGGILFYEYRTDDARLTIEVMKKAVETGATLLNYSKVKSFLYKNEKIFGAVIEDQFTKQLVNINAKYVVNATGPWVDELDVFDKTSLPNKLHITKGIHLVIDHKKLPVKQSMYFDTHDKRMIFVIPREGKTYVGTTDTFYHDDINNPTIQPSDRDYIIKCINDFFPNCNIELKDVESGWAGLRPLINKPGKGPSEISRKDEVFSYDSGLLTISGGKLTGYRKMAQRITDIVASRIKKDYGIDLKQCSTERINLSGGKINEVVNFKKLLEDLKKEGVLLNLTNSEVELLAHRYGANTFIVFEIINKINEEERSDIPVILRAQLLYCIENEMCYTLSDFFIRRTGALYFDVELVRKYYKELAVYIQTILKLNDVEVKMQIDNLMVEIDKLNKISSN